MVRIKNITVESFQYLRKLLGSLLFIWKAIRKASSNKLQRFTILCFREKIIAAGGLPPLIEMLASGSPLQAEKAAIVLENLAAERENAEAIVKAGVESALLSRLNEKVEEGIVFRFNIQLYFQKYSHVIFVPIALVSTPSFCLKVLVHVRKTAYTCQMSLQ